MPLIQSQSSFPDTATMWQEFLRPQELPSLTFTSSIMKGTKLFGSVTSTASHRAASSNGVAAQSVSNPTFTITKRLVNLPLESERSDSLQDTRLQELFKTIVSKTLQSMATDLAETLAGTTSNSSSKAFRHSFPTPPTSTLTLCLIQSMLTERSSQPNIRRHSWPCIAATGMILVSPNVV